MAETKSDLDYLKRNGEIKKVKVGLFAFEEKNKKI